MTGIDTLFPLSRKTPFTRIAVAAIIFLTASLAFTLIVYAAGSLFFPGWSEARLRLAEGNIENVAPEILRYLQIGQEFSLFIIPSLLISFAMSLNITSFMGINKSPGLTSFFLVVVLALFVIVVNTLIAWLNSHLVLPQRWSSMEEWMRAKEMVAERYTIILTSRETSPSILTNIFIIALLPAIGEEMFFRGILQKLFSGFFKNGHAAVWITAIIFSAIHFQFYGFFPRLVLGLIYGYLFLWSGSIWLPVTAHFVNNFVSVMIAWFSGWKEGSALTEDFVIENLFSVLFATVVVGFLLSILKKRSQAEFPGI